MKKGGDSSFLYPKDFNWMFLVSFQENLIEKNLMGEVVTVNLGE